MGVVAKLESGFPLTRAKSLRAFRQARNGIEPNPFNGKASNGQTIGVLKKSEMHTAGFLGMVERDCEYFWGHVWGE